jgi:hypothetical protein
MGHFQWGLLFINPLKEPMKINLITLLPVLRTQVPLQFRPVFDAIVEEVEARNAKEVATDAHIANLTDHVRSLIGRVNAQAEQLAALAH